MYGTCFDLYVRHPQAWRRKNYTKGDTINIYKYHTKEDTVKIY